MTVAQTPSGPPDLGLALRGSAKRRRRESSVKAVFLGAALTSVLISFFIVQTLIVEAWHFLDLIDLSQLWEIGWFPRRDLYDLRTLFVGSLLVTLIAMLVATPLGLGAAVYLSEYASPRVRRVLKPVLEVLASIPSVVLGFFALRFINPFGVERFTEWLAFPKLAPGDPSAERFGLLALCALVVAGALVLGPLRSRSQGAASSTTVLVGSAVVALGTRLLYRPPDDVLAVGSWIAIIVLAAVAARRALAGDDANGPTTGIVTTFVAMLAVLPAVTPDDAAARWGVRLTLVLLAGLVVASTLGLRLAPAASRLVPRTGGLLVLAAVGCVVASIATGGGDGSDTFNVMAAGIGVGVLIIPLVASVAEDAMRAVPQSLREAGYGLGARPMTVAVQIVFPAAISGIVAALILAVSRAIGETLVVAIAAGGSGGSLFSTDTTTQGNTITAAIASLSFGSDNVAGADAAFPSLYFLGLLLFVVTFLLNIVGDLFVRRTRQVY